MHEGWGVSGPWEWNDTNTGWYKFPRSATFLKCECMRQIPEGIHMYENVAVVGKSNHRCFSSFQNVPIVILPLNSMINSIKTNLCKRETILQLLVLNESRAPYAKSVCFWNRKPWRLAESASAGKAGFLEWEEVTSPLSVAFHCSQPWT